MQFKLLLFAVVIIVFVVLLLINVVVVVVVVVSAAWSISCSSASQESCWFKIRFGWLVCQSELCIVLVMASEVSRKFKQERRLQAIEKKTSVRLTTHYFDVVGVQLLAVSYLCVRQKQFSADDFGVVHVDLVPEPDQKDLVSCRLCHTHWPVVFGGLLICKTRVGRHKRRTFQFSHTKTLSLSFYDWLPIVYWQKAR